MCPPLAQHARRRHKPTHFLSISPFRDADSGSLAKLGLNFELIHQASYSGKSESQSSGGGEADLQRLFEIANSRPLVLSNDLNAPASGVRNGSNRDFTAPSIADDVPRKFRNRSSDEGELGERKPCVRGCFPALLTRLDNICVTADRNSYTVSGRRWRGWDGRRLR